MQHYSIEDYIKSIIQIIEKDVNHDGSIRSELEKTPHRVAKSYKELFAGYNMRPEDVLSKMALHNAEHNDYIWLKNIEFNSMCEHHMLPFTGTVDICYTPKQHIVGLSKLNRIVDVFAKRLQLQERLTFQIANSIFEHLDCDGVGVRIRAKHFCMVMRGVNKMHGIMETMHFCGSFKTHRKTDFLSGLTT